MTETEPRWKRIRREREERGDTFGPEQEGAASDLLPGDYLVAMGGIVGKGTTFETHYRRYKIGGVVVACSFDEGLVVRYTEENQTYSLDARYPVRYRRPTTTEA